MSKINILEQDVKQLTQEELAQFRDWFLEYEWEAWDRQIERDSQSGKLDQLARKALDDHASGRTTPL